MDTFDDEEFTESGRLKLSHENQSILVGRSSHYAPQFKLIRIRAADLWK